MAKISWFFALLTCFWMPALDLVAQGEQLSHELCGSDFAHSLHLRTNPNYLNNLRTGEELIQRSIQDPSFLSSRRKYTIPVAVHILHIGERLGSGSNLPDSTIAQAIAYANSMFRADPEQGFFGPDIEIEFVLAKRTPNCDSTGGIMRVDMSGHPSYVSNGINLQRSAGLNELAVKAKSRWSNLAYLNIWVVNKLDGRDGRQGTFTAGYAYFPGSDARVDGVVILASQMKTGNQTLGHELGHALNLFHTFAGDDDGNFCPFDGDCQKFGDRVCDTDPHIRPKPSTCPENEINSCTDREFGSVMRNFMNYSSCRDRFTFGQKSRMRASIERLRPSLLSSLGAVPVNDGMHELVCVPEITDVDNNFGVGPVKVLFNTIDTRNDSTSRSGSYSTDGAVFIDRTCTHGTEVIAGRSYPIEVFTQINDQKVNVYIDFNNNGDLSDEGEAVFFSESSNGGSYLHKGMITLPDSPLVSNQPLRMRIVSDSPSGGNGPCGVLLHGQAEDYTITIFKPFPPTIQDPIFEKIEDVSARLGAKITDDGRSPILERGVVWSLENDPRIGKDHSTHVADTVADLGSYFVDVLGLPSDSKIFFRGYAINDVDTAYTTAIFIQTKEPITEPVLVDPSSSRVSFTSAVLGADVKSSGGAPLLEQGIVWSTSPSPTIESAKVVVFDTVRIGGYNLEVQDMPVNSTIYFRGYATNRVGTGYTGDGKIQTLEPGKTKIRNFVVLAEESGVFIFWDALETDNANFFIERARDSAIFETTIEIDGFGKGSPGLYISYETLDQPIAQDTFCYRLRYVSINGEQGFSQTECVIFAPAESFVAYPNPASDQISLDIPYFFTDEAHFILADPTGRPYFTQEFLGLKGQSTTIVINTAPLPTGMYFGSVRDGGELYMRRLIVIHE